MLTRQRCKTHNGILSQSTGTTVQLALAQVVVVVWRRAPLHQQVQALLHTQTDINTTTRIFYP